MLFFYFQPLITEGRYGATCARSRCCYLGTKEEQGTQSYTTIDKRVLFIIFIVKKHKTIIQYYTLMKVSMPLYSKRTRLDHKYRLDKIEKAVGKARFLGYNLFHEIRIVFC